MYRGEPQQVLRKEIGEHVPFLNLILSLIFPSLDKETKPHKPLSRYAGHPLKMIK